jgi:hypothetical protein
MVLRSLVSSTYRVRSVLASAPRARQVETIVAGVDAPIYVADPEVLTRVRRAPRRGGPGGASAVP